ncbi:vWA domain-containing protein [Desulfofustis limnaeus]|jgi:uncharacterized protein with von Willebrand factor type A (vWA) domain|uniref:VWA containing CoxE family protein n=1 Tax=Desulfofustis limnaeus TaxID=2740163 RepID=A0ABM7W690_9BACT|nr:hypothetical protein [Desulfofustis limnaeus]MDX9896014.1 hypothetical protein [Desulfofustis sp.]BDD86457.1 hypothetical protein DPPLL_08220 [Desulfofustis limnaeus]
MFIAFFYLLRSHGVPVSPTSFLRLQRALSEGLVASVDDLYVAARTILIKDERYFDSYDRVFGHLFAAGDLPGSGEQDELFWAQFILDEWLRDPKSLAMKLGVDERDVQNRSIDELLDYFRRRLREQDGRHDGGSKWIGTGGTSPVGHSGYHPGGMRVGGASRHKSAVQVAAERRYREYAHDRPLGMAGVGDALKKLRHLVPRGVRDQLNVDESIRQTIKNGGEIEIVFDRSSVDRLKVVLLIDNGGWSMDPYVDLVQLLFSYARSQFKELSIYYFHNTVYDLLWEDAGRHRRPVRIDRLGECGSETRLIMVGDASMAPYELMVPDGSIYAFQKSGRPSIEQLRLLTGLFPHHAWLNPVPAARWHLTRSIGMIRSMFPMFELSLDGLEQAVAHLMSRSNSAFQAL